MSFVQCVLLRIMAGVLVWATYVPLGAFSFSERISENKKHIFMEDKKKLDKHIEWSLILENVLSEGGGNFSNFFGEIENISNKNFSVGVDLNDYGVREILKDGWIDVSRGKGYGSDMRFVKNIDYQAAIKKFKEAYLKESVAGTVFLGVLCADSSAWLCLFCGFMVSLQ